MADVWLGSKNVSDIWYKHNIDNYNVEENDFTRSVEACLGPCQTSMMKPSAKIVNG